MRIHMDTTSGKYPLQQSQTSTPGPSRASKSSPSIVYNPDIDSAMSNEDLLEVTKEALRIALVDSETIFSKLIDVINEMGQGEF
jgi:hypothetical protein